MSCLRAEVAVDWPLSSLTLEPFGGVKREWELKWSWRILAHLKSLGSEGKDSAGLREGLTKSKENGMCHLEMAIF